MSITNLSIQQLRKAADLKEKIAELEKELGQLLGTKAVSVTSKPAKKGMSAAGKARIIAAQKARWAAIKAAKIKPAVVKPVAKAITTLKIATKPVAKAAVKAAAPKPVKKKFVMSAAAKAKISAAAKARWAKIKAAKK